MIHLPPAQPEPTEGVVSIMRSIACLLFISNKIPRSFRYKKMTADIYTHVANEQIDEAAVKIGSIFSEGSKSSI
jgi:hypothetical protein